MKKINAPVRFRKNFNAPKEIKLGDIYDVHGDSGGRHPEMVVALLPRVPDMVLMMTLSGSLHKMYKKNIIGYSETKRDEFPKKSRSWMNGKEIFLIEDLNTKYEQDIYICMSSSDAENAIKELKDDTFHKGHKLVNIPLYYGE